MEIKNPVKRNREARRFRCRILELAAEGVTQGQADRSPCREGGDMWTLPFLDVAVDAIPRGLRGASPTLSIRGCLASGGTCVATGPTVGAPPAELLHGSVPQTSSPRVDGLLKEGESTRGNQSSGRRQCLRRVIGGWTTHLHAPRNLHDMHSVLPRPAASSGAWLHTGYSARAWLHIQGRHSA